MDWGFTDILAIAVGTNPQQYSLVYLMKKEPG